MRLVSPPNSTLVRARAWVRALLAVTAFLPGVTALGQAPSPPLGRFPFIPDPSEPTPPMPPPPGPATSGSPSAPPACSFLGLP